MKHIGTLASHALRPLAFALALGTGIAPVHAATYTYHGDLMDGDAPAEGVYDLRVRAFAQPGATKTLGEPTELLGVTLTEGRFSVELDLPEDADGITWVDVAVRRAGSGEAFERLGEAQPISKANSTCPGAWALDGNSGAPAGSFLGIAETGSTALVLKASNYAVATFAPRGSADDYGNAPSVALGSPANTATGFGAVVGGGGANRAGGSPCADCANHALGDFSSVGGGRGNIAGYYTSTVGGGIDNTADNSAATVAGGEDNTASAAYSTVGGGDGNIASGEHSVIGGGENNRAAFSNAAIGGGDGNYAAGLGTVGGGIGNAATGFTSTVPGGASNCAGGTYSWAGGRNAYVRSAQGTIDWTCGTNTDDFDGDEGSFVWADSGGSDFGTTGPDQFLIRADGGVGINTATFGNAADLRASELLIKNTSIDPNTDITLLNTTNRGYNLVSVPGAPGAAGEFYIGETNATGASVVFSNRLRIDAAGTTHTVGGVVGDLSDARLKKNLAPIAHPLETLLALRGTMFEYIDPAKAMSAPGARMGFIAQEVQQVLPNWVHPSMDGYLSVGTIGFEALAVEAIRDLKAENDIENEVLSKELADTRAANARLLFQQAADRASHHREMGALLARIERLEARQTVQTGNER